MTADWAGLTLANLVLASASPTRAQLLRASGLDIDVVPSRLDEAAMIAALTAGDEALPPADIAAVLAEAKAGDVSPARPGDWVIGADQTLDDDGRLFAKADSIEDARRNLLALAGRTHALHSAVSLVRDGETVWSHVDTAWLTMREVSPQFVGRYLAAVGDDVLGSVGGYRLEGPGVQLFAHIEGDWFTILGLPLMPLLAELRRREVLVA